MLGICIGEGFGALKGTATLFVGQATWRLGWNIFPVVGGLTGVLATARRHDVRVCAKCGITVEQGGKNMLTPHCIVVERVEASIY